MIRTLGLVLLTLLGACRSTPPLTVMAYNVKHGHGMDDVVDLERIARVIERVDPDVLTLQEIDNGCTRSGGVDQAAWLGERLGMQAVFGPFMPYQSGHYGMAVLSRLPVVSSQNIELPPGPEPRSSLAVRVRALDGREFVVVGIHFYRDEDERLAQARATVAALDTGVPTILAGDFNSTPESVVMSFLEASFLNVDKGDDHFTFDSVTPEKEIDYFLLRPADGFEVVGVDVLDEPVASDHRPLVLDVHVR